MARMISLNPNARGALSACILLILMVPKLPALADTIVFQDPRAQQNGTVVSEDDSSVTIRFPKSVVKSISRTSKNTPVSDGDKVILEEKDGFHILKIPDHLLHIGSTAGGQNRGGVQPKTSPVPPSGSKGQAPSIQDKLVAEEMSTVQGTILWKGKPLQGSVKIVMTKYTGFSFASLLKVFSSGPANQSKENEIVLTTRADEQGHYSFANVPPGFYRLYWQPTGETDWIRRLREKPDFEVVAGKMCIQNIPAK
jgi:hypothetical protein